MSIKLWNTTINKMYLWSTEIKKAYLWSTLIYDKTATPNWLLSNLVSYYKMDTNGSFLDAHWSNNGTINWASYTASGKINWGYDFDGINDYVTIWDIYSWSGSFTIWFWFNSDVSAISWDYNILWRYSNNSWFDTSRCYYWGFWNNQLQWKWSTWTTSGANNTLTINQAFTPWVWYYVIFELDDIAKVARFYLNWVLHTSQWFTWNVSKSTQATQNFSIWNRFYNANEWFNWKIDEIGIWNWVLTTKSIDIYNSGAWLSYDNFTT